MALSSIFKITVLIARNSYPHSKCVLYYQVDLSFFVMAFVSFPGLKYFP